ncbi:MAG: DUF2087 domain-containing protein [Chloroflexota bacterium]
MIPADVLAALRTLVDIGRIRLLGLIAARPAAAEALAAEVRRPLPAVRRDLEALVAAGLAEARATAAGEVFAARADHLGIIARALAAAEREARGYETPRGGAWPHDGESLEATESRLALTPDERRTLRAYLEDGRLTTIPARGAKRSVILRFLRERVFTEDRAYPEKEVNQRLALFHADVAALRRYLVDDGLVTRERGEYRRAGERPTLPDPAAGA